MKPSKAAALIVVYGCLAVMVTGDLSKKQGLPCYKTSLASPDAAGR